MGGVDFASSGQAASEVMLPNSKTTRRLKSLINRPDDLAQFVLDCEVLCRTLAPVRSLPVKVTLDITHSQG